jgi:hypothetical protein
MGIFRSKSGCREKSLKSTSVRTLRLPKLHDLPRVNVAQSLPVGCREHAAYRGIGRCVRLIS